MVGSMKSWLTKAFIINWQRKLISFVLAIIIWLLVNHSLITEKTYTNVPVRVSNVPAGMVIQNQNQSGYLNNKVTLKIVGYKKILDELAPQDIQILLNAQNRDKEWVASINKNQVVFLNKFINPYPYIRSINHEPFVVSLTDQEPQDQ